LGADIKIVTFNPALLKLGSAPNDEKGMEKQEMG
jgi:hypothetical protein